jgi:NAD-dependent dihydropyrimidine dehydrogenase PreA subunit/flavodoxin
MLKNGAAIFFSGTGNTKYIARLFKERLKKENINIDIIDIQKEESLNKEYDFYIFGGPIHAEMIPKILTDWVVKNIPNENKKCIVYHTLAGDKHSPSRIYLAKLLNKKGLDVVINTSIQMPNNYYHRFFKRETDEEISNVLSLAPNRVDEIVKDFINDNRSNINYKKNIMGLKMVYGGFLKYAKNYAKRNFSLDEKKCINCKICEHECPTKNISMNDKKIEFYNNCIGCEKCIHRCPTNAILFGKKPFIPYKIEKYLDK